LPSLGDAKGARPPLVWLHVSRCAMASNRSTPFPSLPLHRLDQASIESPGVAIASHQPALGFCPFPSARAADRGEREESRGRRGEAGEGRRRVAAGASLLRSDGDARSRTREAPYVTAEEPDRSEAPP
jgi:hypothetical protein